MSNNNTLFLLQRKTHFFVIFAFLLLILAGFKLFFVSESKNIESLNTVLVSQKNMKFVDTIQLQSENGQVLTLEKKFTGDKTIWVGVIQDIIFPVDSSKMAQFLQFTVKNRTIKVLADENLDYAQYNLDSKNAFQITFSGIDDFNNSRTFLHIYFGLIDVTGRNINFRTNSSNAVFRMVNDFYSFCSVDSSAWVEGKFLPSTLLENRERSQVRSLTYTVGKDFSNSSVYLSDDQIVQEVTNILFSMQSSVLSRENDLQNARLRYSITVQFEDKTRVSFSVFEKEANSQSEKILFFVKPEGSKPYSYALKISEWSMLRMEELFNYGK